MKDEEMAEEYLKQNNYTGGYIGYFASGYCKQAFLAGLKAGRPQWHDLEKDPTDLPKEEKQYVVKAKDLDGDITVWICWYWTETKTFTGSYLSEYNVIKWKEIE